jgi:tRNA-modifying protein YgfZ
MWDSTLSLAYRTSAVMFPAGLRSVVQLTGADRAKFLNNFCTQDVISLAPGQGRELFLCNVKGRVLAHGHVFAEESALWLTMVEGAAASCVAHLDRYLIREEVQFADRSADFRCFWLAGAHAAAALSQLCTESPDILSQRPSMASTVIVAASGIGFARRLDHVSNGSWELLLPATDADSLIGRLTAQGVAVGTQPDWQSLRIHAGWPEYGRDITDENLAQEVGRTPQAISFTKGCYLGQEPIARLDAMGHTNRELRRLRGLGDSPPEPGTPLLSADGQTAGVVTSSAAHPFEAGSVALGYVRTKWAQPGTKLRAGEIDVLVAEAASA